MRLHLSKHVMWDLSHTKEYCKYYYWYGAYLYNANLYPLFWLGFDLSVAFGKWVMVPFFDQSLSLTDHTRFVSKQICRHTPPLKMASGWIEFNLYFSRFSSQAILSYVFLLCLFGLLVSVLWLFIHFNSIWMDIILNCVGVVLLLSHQILLRGVQS